MSGCFDIHPISCDIVETHFGEHRLSDAGDSLDKEESFIVQTINHKIANVQEHCAERVQIVRDIKFRGNGPRLSIILNATTMSVTCT